MKNKRKISAETYKKYFSSGKWAERAETSRKLDNLIKWARKFGEKIGVRLEI